MQLVECVPNFSEGRDQSIISEIAGAIRAIEGAVLLDIDRGSATNRTVMTLVGPPGSVEEAAFRAIETAGRLIDMSRHHGEHPRMGATDVCPFVPLEDTTMDECVELARRLGQRVGEELGIPVFLYEHAALRDERRPLADVRRGEYEGLAARTDAPDYGPGEFNPRSGATAVGAREFLIAYNINLNTPNKSPANQIAGMLRESGTPRRDPSGVVLRDAEGNALREPGEFKELRGVGWYIEEYRRAQLSFNLTNYKVTSLHDVFEAARRESRKLGLRVTGSELVGLVPREALLATGDYYLRRQGTGPDATEEERVWAGVLSLGLNDLAPFDPGAKIIEYRYRNGPVVDDGGPLAAFIDELSSDRPAPGGGSVAALCGSLAAALAAMVAGLTASKKGMEDVREQMEDVVRRARALATWFLHAVERDTGAFNQVLAARRLPRATDAERASRAAAIEAADRQATRVPLEVLERTVAALELVGIVARYGNPNAITDAGMAGACAGAAGEGAMLNIRINLAGMTDEAWAATVGARAGELVDRCRQIASEIRELVEASLRT